MEIGMQTTEELPIELECWLLKWGILPQEHRQSKPDIVWPEVKENPFDYQAWKPTPGDEEPPF